MFAHPEEPLSLSKRRLEGPLSSGPAPSLLHRARKVLEILCFGEILVDAGEADVGDRVQGLETIHHQLADFGRGDFAFAAGFDLALEGGDQAVDALLGDGALAAGGGDRAFELGAFERLAAAAGFDDGELAQLDALEGGEARAAIL